MTKEELILLDESAFRAKKIMGLAVSGYFSNKTQIMTELSLLLEYLKDWRDTYEL